MILLVTARPPIAGVAVGTIAVPPVACAFVSPPAPILPGAEPFSATGGTDGALCLHGFTGTPQALRGVAEQLAAAGLTVELPLLPGHGTAVADLVPTRWPDWSACAEQAYLELAARCDRVVLVGLSMGGTLACWLAAHHPEVAGLALGNPLVAPPDPALRAAAQELLANGTETVPGIGSDIADHKAASELSYPETPLAAALSLFDATADLAGSLGEIACPVLLLSSRQDHVVPPDTGDRLVQAVLGPIRRVWLERSYHVATLDYDREEVEERIVAFAQAVLDGAEG